MSKKPKKGAKQQIDDNIGLVQETTRNTNEDETKRDKEINLNIKTVTITLEYYQNVLGMFPICDIKTRCTYMQEELGETDSIPVTDDEKLLVNKDFELNIDTAILRELDALISNPVILTVYQMAGAFEQDLYEQLVPNEGIIPVAPIKSFESVVSIYEAFTDQKLQTTHSNKKLNKPKKEASSDKKLKIENKGSKRSRSSSFTKMTRSSVSLKKSETGSIVTESPPKLYGMCMVDMLPLFHGKKSFTETLLIKPVEIFKDERMSTFKNHPKLVVTVSIEDELELQNSALINFTVETIYNVPEIMQPQMDYKIAAILPMGSTQKDGILFTNPLYTFTRTKDAHKCWYGMRKIGKDANTTKYKINDDIDDISCKFNPDLEMLINTDNPRLEFNMLKRNLVLQDEINELGSHIQTYRKIVVEFFMTNKSKSQNHNLQMSQGSKEKEIMFKPVSEDSQKKIKQQPFLHLMAILDVSSLAYPGVNRVRVACPLRTYSAEEIRILAGLNDSYFIPSKRDTKESTPKESSDVKKDKKKTKELSSASKSSKSSKTKVDKGATNYDMKNLLPPKPEELPAPEPSIQVYNENGQPCFVVVEIELSRPITPKKDIEDLSDELYSLLQKLPQNQSKVVLNACLSQNHYKEVVSDIIRNLNQQYQSFLSQYRNPKGQPHLVTADFLKFLQNSGIYQTYLNSMTKAASLVCSTKYIDLAVNKTNSPVYQSTISEIFIYLVSEMNDTINKLVCDGLEPTIRSDSSKHIFFYAKEAAQLGKTKLANRYFLERICNDVKNPNYWFDYAVFHLELRDDDTAFECVKEALSLKKNHVKSLIMLGALLANKGLANEAETCFLNAMVYEPNMSEGWGVLYLFYQKQNNFEGMDVSYDMAKKYASDVRKSNDYFESYDDLLWTDKIIPNTIFFNTAVLLLKMRLFDWAENACSQEVHKYYGIANYLLAAICYYRGLYTHALDHIEESKSFYGADYAVFSLSGHCLAALERNKEAKEEYYHVLESFNRPQNISWVNINCARVLECLKEDQEARKLILYACKYNPTPYTWLKAGQLYIQENDLLSAEECLTEGNLRDNRNAEIWGYLTLVNLSLNRPQEAELCFDQSLKNKLDEHNLLNRIQQEFEKVKHCR